MQRIKIEGPRERQYAEISGIPAIRSFRTTETKPLEKKKKWTYNPNQNRGSYDKAFKKNF